MKKFIIFIIAFFLGIYCYKHKEDIKQWTNKALGKVKTETITKAKNTLPFISKSTKFSIATGKKCTIKSDNMSDINITLVSTKNNDSCVVSIDKERYNLQIKEKQEVIKQTKNNKFVLKLSKVSKDKADFETSISVIKEEMKNIQVIGE